MATDPEVDPDAQTAMPAAPREQAPGLSTPGFSAAVALTRPDSTVVRASLVGVSAQGIQIAVLDLPEMDEPFTIELPTDPAAIVQVHVVWTRAGKGLSPAMAGLDFRSPVEGIEPLVAKFTPDAG